MSSEIVPELLGLDAEDVANHAVGGARAVGTREFQDSIAAKGLETLGISVEIVDLNAIAAARGNAERWSRRVL